MRLPYTPNPPTPSSPEDQAIVSRIAARRAPRPLQPLDLALLHSPPVADGWNSFLGAVRTRTTLDARARELAICRVAVCNRAWYEWGHHAPLAVAAGVSAEAMEVVKRGELVPGGDKDEDEEGKGKGKGKGKREREREEEARKEAEGLGLGEREWAVLRYADEMTRNVEVSDAVFGALRKVCSEREVVEVTATVSL
ncbi:hypothetical protein K449DRAFT_380006 [Hypoxylon sp. EC38]|nr:hypothetical protein K449DRAFT_380006 [Hypoxylon sp. EC38]